MIREVESLWAIYQKEIGDAQNFTKIKDSAIAKMNTWMYEFYTVARLALKDQPQLLEALGKVVKNCNAIIRVQKKAFSQFNLLHSISSIWESIGQ
jgi:hypothetical protein